MYIQREDNHETRIAESEKSLKHYRFKHKFNITFLFNFPRLTEEVETLKKNDRAISNTWQLSSREDIREALTISTGSKLSG